MTAEIVKLGSRISQGEVDLEPHIVRLAPDETARAQYPQPEEASSGDAASEGGR